MITVRKCAGCEMIVYDLSSKSETLENNRRKYGIRAAPTMVIDGKIKVEGIPDFGFVCDENFYKFLEQNFSMQTQS